MSRVDISRIADAEITEIGLYVAARNPIAAGRILADLDDLFRMLGTHPELGERHTTPHRRDVRRFPLGSYVIYYRLVEGGVEILRVLHGAREQGKSSS
ncbi:MAG: type II toxin-antitoxin system RelE/ParE family toxin [Planctomycetia bacterium]|nr:type II toxin-antitoxin system RelE/ParE family toxin [Planctomycetia bacterium]